MKFEDLLRQLRDQRTRIGELREVAAKSDDDIGTLMAEQALYDSRLVDLARMLDVPVPHAMPREGGLYADHRVLIEDRLAEAGADVRTG
ncbi:MAG TPA: hypothetical protein VM345_15445 [Acidimicrobiales bacterium]|jgi:hypothetical protein|nr:hypothetical protein [Acidimicrobiales bacterium]